MDENYLLLLVSDGNLFEEMKDKARLLQIEDNVIFASSVFLISIAQSLGLSIGIYVILSVKSASFVTLSETIHGMVYESYNLPKQSPTVGLFFMASDYILFVSDLKEYLSADLTFSPSYVGIRFPSYYHLL